MAKFTKFLVLCLLLESFVGAFGAELSEADKVTLVNEIAAANIQGEIPKGVKTSETTLTMFLKEMQLKGVQYCGSCFGGACFTPGCTCDPWPFCTTNGLPKRAGVKSSETTLTMFLKEMQQPPLCGYTCFGGACEPGCICNPWPFCTHDGALPDVAA